MKIALFSDCYLDLTGGIIQVMNTQKYELEKSGHTVYIFSTGFPRKKSEIKKLAQQNIFVVPSCRLFFRGVLPVSRRPRIIERWLIKNFPELKEFDIFHSHYEGGCSIAGMRLGKKWQIPVVQTMHGREDMGITGIIPFGLQTFVATAFNWFHSWYLSHPLKIKRDNYLAPTIARAKMWTLMVNHANQADLVITPSRHFAKKLKHYGVKKPLEVLPNSVPDKMVETTVQPKTLAAGETLKIIWHGRICAEKRILPFLEALSKVEGKYHMDVFGDGGDLISAKAFARRHQLNVKFWGAVPFNKLIPKIMQSHLDVLVSVDGDTFGMTLIEAEALGVPVFFVDPDMKEIVPEGGFVMSRDPSPKAMAETLNELLAQPERIAMMSRVMLAHRDEVRQSRRIGQLIKIYEQLKK